MVQEGDENDALKAYLKSVHDEFDKAFNIETEDNKVIEIETDHNNIRNDQNVVPERPKDDILRPEQEIIMVNLNAKSKQNIGYKINNIDNYY